MTRSMTNIMSLLLYYSFNMKLSIHYFIFHFNLLKEWANAQKLDIPNFDPVSDSVASHLVT